MVFAVVFTEAVGAGKIPKLGRNMVSYGGGADREGYLARRKEGEGRERLIGSPKMVRRNHVTSHVELGRPR
jgi:hypothetical protein